MLRGWRKEKGKRKFVCFVLFQPIKKGSFNLLCVLDPFSERWQSTSTQFQIFF